MNYKLKNGVRFCINIQLKKGGFKNNFGMNEKLKDFVLSQVKKPIDKIGKKKWDYHQNLALRLKI